MIKSVEEKCGTEKDERIEKTLFGKTPPRFSVSYRENDEGDGKGSKDEKDRYGGKRRYIIVAECRHAGGVCGIYGEVKLENGGQKETRVVHIEQTEKRKRRQEKQDGNINRRENMSDENERRKNGGVCEATVKAFQNLLHKKFLSPK